MNTRKQGDTARMKIVVVHDAAMACFLNPFATPHIGGAIRSFMDEARNEQSPVFAHPEDYDLYLIGEFDTDTGNLIAQEPMQIASATDAKDSKNVQK